jgi:PAS domain S-box-containing protein
LNVAYLLFLPLAVVLVMMTHVFAQNPRGRANQVFALYMLDLAVASCAMLVLSTTSDPKVASDAAILVIVTAFVVNGTFVVTLTLALFFPHALLRWYGAPLFTSGGIALSAALIAEGLFGLRWFYVPSPALGHGYPPLQDLILGSSVGFLLFAWLFACVLVALVLQIVTWFRTRPGERTALTLLIASLLIGSAATPLLPPGPLSAQLPAMLFPAVYALVVSRYRFLLVGRLGVVMPAQIALNTVFRGASEGMVICNQYGQVEQVNLAAEQLTGVVASDAVGRPFAEAFAALVHQAAEGISLVDAVTTELQQPVEMLLRIPEPTPRILALSGNPIRDPHGRYLGCFLILRDMTEQERAREALQTQARLTETIHELSSPIVPVMEGILVLPLIGALDSERTRTVLDDMLKAISREKARAILIDITGVLVVDTMVANLLLQAVHSARLLGCQGILVGIRSEVARTLVALGVDLHGLVTKGSLQDGLSYAMERLKTKRN